MNKKLVYSVLGFAALMFSCNPAEDREVLSGALTADQIQVTAIPQVIEGKNSNYIDLNSDGVGVLSSWDYGSGITAKTKTTVQLVLQGENQIKFMGRNHDGSMIEKILTVQVDTLIDVPAEWGYFCGSGEKVWTWDDTQPEDANESTGPTVWGNGGYKGNVTPGWWKVGLDGIDKQAAGEGKGAEMIFAVSGSKLTINKTDGTSESGTFSFDMTNQTLDDGGAVWAKGKLSTKTVSMLCGIAPNEGNVRVYEYDILSLDDDKMALARPEPGQGSWGTAWFWMFKAK